MNAKYSVHIVLVVRNQLDVIHILIYILTHHFNLHRNARRASRAMPSASHHGARGHLLRGQVRREERKVLPRSRVVLGLGARASG